MHVATLPYSRHPLLSMPVQPQGSYHPSTVLLLDHKGPCRCRRHLEPVCCCERCYAFLANPLVAKLEDGPWDESATAFVAAHGGGVGCGREGGEGVLLKGDWFALCPWTSAGDYERVGADEDGTLIGLTDDSPPLVKKRMTNEKTSLDAFIVDPSPPSFITRRPLTDLQRGVVPTNRPSNPPSSPSPSLHKRPDSFHPSRPGPGGAWPGSEGRTREEARSWVHPPPNRTICHIVDDLTMERLTAASSPVLTRCCVASVGSAGRKTTTTGGNAGRNAGTVFGGGGGGGGKAKAKNQCVSR